MARTYAVPAANITLANQAVTLVFCNVGTTTSLEFLRMWASQSSSNNTAQQRVQINTQVSAFPTLTSQTPTKQWLLDPASQITGGSAGAAGTAGINASATGGNGSVTVSHGANTVSGANGIYYFATVTAATKTIEFYGFDTTSDVAVAQPKTGEENWRVQIARPVRASSAASSPRPRRA